MAEFLTPQGQEDLVRYGLNERNMEEWLRLQSEKLQASIVQTRNPLIISPVIYFATRRATHSDVVSIITTTKVCEPELDDGTPRDTKGLKAPFKDSLYTSPLRNVGELRAEEHERRNKALLREHARFMSKLKQKRLERQEVEYRAAESIQRIFRGFLLRKWLKKTVKKLKVRRRLQRSYNVINRQVQMKKEMEENLRKAENRKGEAATNIKRVYRGYVCRRYARKERAQREQEVKIRACTRMQAIVRGRLAKRAYLQALAMRHKERGARAIRLIQKVYRGHLGRRAAHCHQIALERVCALLIQRAWRRFLARCVCAVARRHVEEERRNAAAMALQRLVRGVAGRAAAYAVRHEEEMELREAAALSLQRTTRGWFGRCLVRGERQRQVEERRLRALLTLQCEWRRALSGARVAEEAEAQQQDIFVQMRLGNGQGVEDLFAGFGTDRMYSNRSLDRRGNTLLGVAARWGHKKLVRRALRWGCALDHKNDASETAVALAVCAGHDEVGEYLLSKGAAVEFYGRTLLHEAAARNQTGVMVALLHRGVPIDGGDEQGRTALHEASAEEMPDAVQLLMDRGADLDAQDGEGSTPLHLAASRGHAKIISRLVDGGADVAVRDHQGRGAWRRALANEHEACAALLRKGWSAAVAAEAAASAAASLTDEERAAALRAARAGQLGPVEAAMDKGLPVDYQERRSGDTLLLCAASGGNVALATLCVRKGASLALTNAAGECAVLRAARQLDACMPWVEGSSVAAEDDAAAAPSSPGGSGPLSPSGRRPGSRALSAGQERATAMVEYLIAQGADVTMRDARGDCALHCLARHGLAALIKAGCRGGRNGQRADVNCADGDGAMPLHYAAHCAHKAAVKTLLRYGASPAATTASPLHFADAFRRRVTAEGGAPPTPTSVLAYGRGRHSSPAGTTALHLCAAQRRNGLSVARLLLQSSGAHVAAMVGAADGSGQTAGMVASRAACSAVLGYLLDQGGAASLHAVDGAGRGAAHYAAHVGSLPCLNLTLSYGADVTAQDARQCTPLALACGLDLDTGGSGGGSGGSGVSLHAGHAECVAALLARGAQPVERAVEGKTPLHIAASAGNIAGVQALLDAVGDGVPDMIDLSDDNGTRPLAAAVLAGQAEAAALLLRHGCDPLLEEYVGPDADKSRTLLHAAAAASMDSADLYNTVLRLGYDPRERDADGASSIHLAAAADNPGVVAASLAAGCEVSDRDAQQRTPLHYAAAAGAMAAATALVRSHGADKNAAAADGGTPVQAAAAADRDDLVEFLLS